MTAKISISLYQSINYSLSAKEYSFKVQCKCISDPTVQKNHAQISTSLIDLLGGHPNLIEVI